MKISELWLREWVNLAIDSSRLVEQITMAGLEVDRIEAVASCFNGVVVGRVVECCSHPSDDKLWLTKIDIGGKRLLDIVCGLPCRTNLRVAVATVGALLPGNIKIKTSKLSGQFSEGMLCSFSVLGIHDEDNGVIEFPADAPVGRDIRDYLQLDDNIINISVTPNRADCLAILGIARDVAVMNRLPLQQPKISAVESVINDTLSIKVEVPDACPRYLGRVIKDIDLNVSTPLWMKEKLRRCGIRSVDAVVDITNYVLLELGQPMHAFDLNSINGAIHVRWARGGEGLTLLDGREVILTPDTLVVADQRKVLAMAGIFGCAQSSIRPMTCDIVLECAFFNPLAIIGRARRYGLHTDSSHRYERGVDPALQEQAMNRSTSLLVAICGGKPGPVIDVTTTTALPQAAIITLRRAKLDRVIGHFIADHEVSDILTRLGFKVTQINEGWQAIAPSWRFDMEIEEDLIEEVARIYGYNTIPNIPVHAKLEMLHHYEGTLPLSRVKTLLVDRGYQEVITYSFVDPKIQAFLHPEQTSLLLPNPVSVEMSAMRLSLWTGLLVTVVYNQNRQQQRIRLFESGLCFISDKEADLGIRQDFMLAGVLAGLRCEEHWDLACQPVDFYDAKGDLEAIFELAGKLDDIEFKAQVNPALHPGQSAKIYLKGGAIGFIGVIHPVLEEKLNLNGRTLVFELLWEKITERNIPKAINISRFPANRRDIAVIVPEDIPAADIMVECKKIIGNLLVKVNLFDVYRGRGIAKGFKSLAISLILQDTARSLEKEEIVTTVSKCVATLKTRFQASLRD